MLSIFSVPKPFRGHIEIIQRNAISSWLRVHPHCEIILCGNEPGTEQTAAEFKVRYIPNIDRNNYGTPLLNSVFDQVGRIASHRLLCYVNADILLLGDFLCALQRIRFPRFLMVGQRWNVDLNTPWDFERADWEERLRGYVANYGALHPPSGSDYFVFPRGSAIEKLPPFAVGRPGWDNYLIYKARHLGIPVVDATRVVTVVHQNHDYAHVANQQGEWWEGPEADWNRSLLGGRDHIFTLLDATHLMRSRLLLPAVGYPYLRRRWQTLSMLAPTTRPLGGFLNRIPARLRSWLRFVRSQ